MALLNGIRRDLVCAGRSLANARAFTFVCVVSLGIGMVPVIAIPYWARVLKTPPAGVKTEGLGEVVTTARGTRGGGNGWSYPDFVALRDSNTGIGMTPADLRTESVETMFVSANYFKTIGLPLARGTGLDAAGDNPLTAEPVVIVGHRYWQNHKGADPDIIGKTLTLDGVPHLVVGVAPEHFSGHMGYLNEFRIVETVAFALTGAVLAQAAAWRIAVRARRRRVTDYGCRLSAGCMHAGNA